MSYNKLLLLAQFILFCNNYDIVTAKALLGNDIEPAEEGIFSSFVCIAQRIPINSNPDDLVICTGALISSTHILTAEHCVDDQSEPFQLIVGSTDLSTGLVHYPLWWLTFDWWTVTMGQSPGDMMNDIAVIKVIVEVPAHIVPAMIIYEPNPSYFGSNVVIAGWGTGNNGSSPQKLQASRVKIRSNVECEEVVRRIEGSRTRVTENYICSSKRPYTFLAGGDSGGPVLFGNFIIGINQGTCPKLNVSFHPEKINVHMSIYHYRFFVTHAINMD